MIIISLSVNIFITMRYIFGGSETIKPLNTEMELYIQSNKSNTDCETDYETYYETDEETDECIYSKDDYIGNIEKCKIHNETTWNRRNIVCNDFNLFEDNYNGIVICV
tara:strand:+ start:5499 stop:5822 length:324 start_codon:yes stop_codon:yes gene_type:complete